MSCSRGGTATATIPRRASSGEITVARSSSSTRVTTSPSSARERLGLARRPPLPAPAALDPARLRAQQLDDRALTRHQVRVWLEGQLRSARRL
jgi:hypothetical protein